MNWTVKKVRRVLPLIRTIILSVRDRVIQGTYIETQINKLSNDKTVDGMLKLREFRIQDQECEDAIMESLMELKGLGVYLIDPIRAIAIFPFRCRGMDNLKRKAWFVYSPFGNELYWRYVEDNVSVKNDIGEVPC